MKTYCKLSCIHAEKMTVELCTMTKLAEILLVELNSPGCRSHWPSR